MEDNNKFGVITEQGDLALGFEELSEEEQRKLDKDDK